MRPRRTKLYGGGAITVVALTLGLAGALLALAFVWFMHTWNILGYRF